MAWIEARDHIILEDDIVVNLGFNRTYGDRSERSRAYAYTEGGSATEGIILGISIITKWVCPHSISAPPFSYLCTCAIHDEG